MIVNPVHIFAQKYECKNNTIKNCNSFKGRFFQNEIQEVGDKFIKESKHAKNREEFYSVAQSYLKEGLIPIFDKKSLIEKEPADNELRQEVVNMVFSDIELSFDPSLMQLQDSVKHNGLKDERKHFANIVKTVNKIISNWKEANKD